MRITKGKLGVAVTATAVVAVAGTAAYAYFLTGGSGTGSAGAATPSDVTISSNSVSGLYPVANLAAGTSLGGAFSNPNAYSVTVPAVYATITGIDSAHSANCAASNFSVTSGNLLSAPIAVPGQSGATPGSANWSGGQIALVNQAGTDQSGCEGATVNLSFSTTAPVGP